MLKQREPAAPKPDRLASFPEELRQFVQSEVSTIPVRAVAERLSSPHPVTTYLRQKLELGVDSRTVAKLLDHASFRTTEESYLADRAKEKRRAMKLYEDTYLQGILDDSIGFPARDGECWVPPRQDP